MLLQDLQHERNLLQLTLNHHLDALNALGNPSGILLCQKHRNTFRWQHKYLLNGRPVTTNLSKSESALAGKLAVNLYRMICIEYLLRQISLIDSMILRFEPGAVPNTLAGTAPSVMAGPAPVPNTIAGPGTVPNAMAGPGTVPNAMAGPAPIDLLTGSRLHMLLSRVQHCPRTPAEFFHSQSPYKAFIVSLFEEEYAEIIDWYLGDFKQNADHPEALQFPVKLGFNVRSKSEVMEADKLFEAGILFHYEELLLLSEEESYPDFYIPITIAEKYAWEHNGAMDKPSYLYRTKGKILNYLDHQWLPGINMITTYETRQHPLTEEQVNHQIRWLKSRYRLAFQDLPPDESFTLYDLAAIVKYRNINQ